MLNEEVGSMNEKQQREFDLQEQLIDFAVRILNLVEALPNNRIGNHIVGQLARSGTSPAPNYGEACSAESRKDFVHKMKIALKELRETHVWLRIIQRKPLIEPPEKVTPLVHECNELISIFVKSVKTTETNK